jgi:Electron transfer DM13
VKPIFKLALVTTTVVGAGIAWYLVSPLFIDRVVVEAAPEGVVALSAGSFTEVDAVHWAAGTATVYRRPAGLRVLRFEEGFEAANGPDLRVLLSPHERPRDSEQLGEYVELGDLKGNIGTQNYEIPAEIDLALYRSVVIYCSPFHVVFSTATLDGVSPM